MRNYKVIGITLFIILLSFISGCGNRILEQNSSIIDNKMEKQDVSNINKVESDNGTKRYIDKRFKFSVEYPVNWTSKIEDFQEANEEHNGSPDGGINIYVDGKKEDSIYIFGGFGHIDGVPYPDFQREKFKTSSDLSGDLYSNEINGKELIYLILDEEFHGAYINVNLECYKQNKEKIMNVLKSIKLVK